MPLFFQHIIDDDTKLAIWKIEEEEDFFLEKVPLHRQITHPNKRLQHLAGRYLLQHLFPDFPIALIQIADTRKPYLEDEAYHFSISHCNNYAAVIVSKTKRVGIDIEFETTKVDKIKHKFLHEEELNFYNKVENEAFEKENELTYLTLLWSCKETVFKWWSFGNVDFSEQIRLQPFTLQHMGTVDVAFNNGEEKINLELHYHVFNDLCLTWMVT